MSGKGKGISVYCRFRPSRKKKAKTNTFQFLDRKTVQVASESEIDQGTQFKFDRVFPPATTQQEVYDEMGSSIIDQTLNGFNCCLMAYGMTSSGKSHSLYGALKDIEKWGMIPRLSQELFDRLQSRVEQDEDYGYTVHVSLVELYLEQIYDLLHPKNQKTVSIHEKVSEDLGRKEVYIKGCKKILCSDVSDIMKQLNKGDKNRTIGSTNMNDRSSRSHSLCIVEIVQHNSTTGFHLRSKLMLVDLAGSESVRNTHAQGLELKQAQAINKSLTLLALVIKKLSEKKSEHIPYRDSKLTRLLSEALGGNNQTHMLLTCAPEDAYARESIFTMKFGLQAQNIQNAPLVNTIYTLEDYKSMVEQKDQIIQQQSVLIQALETKVEEVKNHTVPTVRPAYLQIDTEAIKELSDAIHNDDIRLSSSTKVDDIRLSSSTKVDDIRLSSSTKVDDTIDKSPIKSPLTAKSVHFGVNTLHPISDQYESDSDEEADEVKHMSHRSMSHDFKQKGEHVLIIPKHHSRTFSSVSNVSVPYTPVSRTELLLQTEVVMRLQEDLGESEEKVSQLEELLSEQKDLVLEHESSLALSKEKVLKLSMEIDKLQEVIQEFSIPQTEKTDTTINISDNGKAPTIETKKGDISSGNSIVFYIGWALLWVTVLIGYWLWYAHKPLVWHSAIMALFTTSSVLVLLAFERIV